MATLYKLTDKKKKTFNNTTWGEGITHSGTGKGPLCGEGWIHAYRHPLLATFFNPIHGNFKNPLLWEAEGEVGIDDGTKVGCQTLTTVRQIELPEMSVVQRVACGILVVKEVCREKEWNEWAERWLSGEDRSADSARDMRQKPYSSSATYATYSSAYYAAYAAEDAYYVIEAIKKATYAAEDAEAAEAAATSAAAYCTTGGKEVDIFLFLQKAMKY